MKLSQSVKLTPEIIDSVKMSYNRTLKRRYEAEKYLDDPTVPISEREQYMILFKVEVVDVLEAYLQVLKDWGIEPAPDEILNGFIVT